MATKTLTKTASSAMKKAGKAISGAVDGAVDTFMNPPTAVNRGPSRKAAKAAGKPMDRLLVSTMEDYEVKYLAQKHSVTQKAVKAAVAKVGHSRSKVERELKAGKV